MSKRLFGSFTVPGTGIEIRCYRDRDATENPYSVYVKHPEPVPGQTYFKYPERIVYRFPNYKDCAVCMTDLVVNAHSLDTTEPPVIPYLLELTKPPVVRCVMDYIEHNYRPVPPANRKEG